MEPRPDWCCLQCHLASCFFMRFLLSLPNAVNSRSLSGCNFWKRCRFVARPEVKWDWWNSSKCAWSQPLAWCPNSSVSEDNATPPTPLALLSVFEMQVLLLANGYIKNSLNPVSLTEGLLAADYQTEAHRLHRDTKWSTYLLSFSV